MYMVLKPERNFYLKYYVTETSLPFVLFLPFPFLAVDMHSWSPMSFYLTFTFTKNDNIWQPDDATNVLIRTARSFSAFRKLIAFHMISHIPIWLTKTQWPPHSAANTHWKWNDGTTLRSNQQLMKRIKNISSLAFCHCHFSRFFNLQFSPLFAF